MQIAVCSSDENEIGRICSLLGECSDAVRRQATAKVFPSEDLFWNAFQPGCFYGIVVCYGDVRGFLFARRVREEDSGCRIVLLDDTDRYAIRGFRIHLNDFLIRPVGSDRLRAALSRLLGE